MCIWVFLTVYRLLLLEGMLLTRNIFAEVYVYTILSLLKSLLKCVSLAMDKNVDAKLHS